MEGRYADDRSCAHLCCCKQLRGEGIKKRQKPATEANTSMDPLLLFLVIGSSVRLTLCGR